MKRPIVMIMLACALFLYGCPEKQPPPLPAGKTMVRIEPQNWPVMDDDLDPGSLSRAINYSRAYLKKLPPDREFLYETDVYTAAHLLESLNVFEDLHRKFAPGPQLTEALKERFLLYQSVGSDGRGSVLFTGYYEPELEGSLDPGPEYPWPLYGPPADLVTVELGDFDEELKGKRLRGRLDGQRLVPYHSRHDIERQGALGGRGLEIAWVKDPVALFFMHIQGSGRIRLPGGEVVRIGYAEANGRPYRSLGLRLLELELMEKGDMSMQGIRDWLTQHPERIPELLDHNPSYVFFRRLEGEVVGNINVPLTPGRSVALDYRLFPKGALAWIAGRKPMADGPKVTEIAPFSRFVLVQDTGGAITGPGKMDLFYGHGVEAEAEAGRTKEPGILYFPVLRKG